MYSLFLFLILQRKGREVRKKRDERVTVNEFVLKIISAMSKGIQKSLTMSLTYI